MGVLTIIACTLVVLALLPTIFKILELVLGMLLSWAFVLAVCLIIIFGVLCVVEYVRNPDRKK